MIALTLDIFELALTQVQFNATPNDIEPYGIELFNRAVAGDFGTIAPFVAPAPIPDINGFITSIKTDFGVIVANNVAKNYPLLTAILEASDWGDGRLLLIDANTTGVITLDQYNLIKANISTFNIPITLP